MIPLDVYLSSGAKRLRCGYTTGTCAAAAAQAATELLLGKVLVPSVVVTTPAGIDVIVEVEECEEGPGWARCGVQKDGGDDPDVTDGVLVYVAVKKIPQGITVDGGEGIGRVTKPGLDQPVGEAAINSVPRQMIRKALEAVCREMDYSGGLEAVITVPEGETVAKRTFNPMLGIEGGISILGTSGIVEPMSERAVVETIALEIRQNAAAGAGRLILTPGNYGMDFLGHELPELGGVARVKCSNFIGEALDLCVLEGIREILLVGHVGKLVKLAGGVMNTHSHMADCRRELFCAHAAICGAGQETCQDLMRQATTDGCLEVLEAAGLRKPVMESLLDEIQRVLERRCADACRVGAVLFSNVHGLLGMTAEAKRMLADWRTRP